MVIRSCIWIQYHFYASLTIVEWEILGDLLAFLIQSPADFHDTRRTEWASSFLTTHPHKRTDWRRQDNVSTDTAMYPYFGSNPADIRIWIRINPEIRIQILDHLGEMPWQRFAFSKHSLVKS